MIQTSILKKIQCSGVGMHSGKTVELTLCPAPENTGIVFIRTDLPNAKVHANPSHLKATPRATMLEENGVRIATPEHLLSACAGLNIHNLIVEISSEEIPIMDGSAAPFVDALLEAGIAEQKQTLTPIQPTTPIWIQDQDKTVLILPSPTLIWTYCLDYPNHFVGKQTITFHHNPTRYREEVALARTYGFKAEVEALWASGLAKGGSLENALVVGETDYLNPPRIDQELCRHKLLDLMGDLSLFGRPLLAHVIGIKSGHNLHMQVVQKLETLL